MKQDIILRDYQSEAIDFMNKNEGKLVLAMCPSSGKTETIIYYLDQLYKSNPNIRALILPHSTNVLLDNFYERLDSRNVEFTYSNNICLDVNVHVILPQNHAKIIGNYDVIIIDEAHENYFAKRIQGIIKKTNAKKQILLTGTPYQFINKKDFTMHFVALSDLDASFIPKLRVDILESDYDWNGKYNRSRELKNNFKFKDELTRSSLKRTFDFILNRNKSEKIKKTIIVCKNIIQSRSVKDYLSKIGLVSEISNSENDKDSSKISDFKNNKFNILIVVNRARLGYDDIDLINLIDISGTLNPNIIYQMFARLLRGSNDTNKYYIRLTAKNDSVLNSEIATSVALMLTHRNYIQQFNGKNFSLNEIILNDCFFKGNKKESKKSSPLARSENTNKKLLIETDDVISFYKTAISEKEKSVGIYKFCKVSDVLNQLRNKITHTLESCKESALKCSTRFEWQKLDANSYKYARLNNHLDECCKHMKSMRAIYTLESCMEIASQYKTKVEWEKSHVNSYSSARRNGWFYECSKHMGNLLIKHTLESCMESALKYELKEDWKRGDAKSYQSSRKNGWHDECTAHMKVSFIKHTLESCMENALKYKTKNAWSKGDWNIYCSASRNGWIIKCTAHMKNAIVRHTLESCVESALKYSNLKDWRTDNSGMYKYAKKNKILDKCVAHMKVSFIKHTLESCMESALKHSVLKDWRTADINSYASAINNGFINQCTAHMETKTHSFESCMESALKYSTKSEWSKSGEGKIYRFALKEGWLDKCTAHMETKLVKHTFESCIESAYKHTNKKDWRIADNKSYCYATKEGWLKECTAHMTHLGGISRTKEECIEDAKKYETSKDWEKNSKNIYQYAQRKEWLKECTAHMTHLRLKIPYA